MATSLAIPRFRWRPRVAVLALVVPLGAFGVAAGPAAPAGACGGLIGENGTIQLTKTSTLAAYHDGIERYVTSFEFTGTGESVGSIVPLPDIPSDVERGGDWTLQRLAQEVAPPPSPSEFAAVGEAISADSAEVLLETTVDALDITILRGGGDEVGRWAAENGFFLTPDAPEVLDFYAERSPIFMAAKFDSGRAAALGQSSGDGTPIMLTIPTEAPWVPLRILSLGLDSSDVVEADVFLLTDEEPELLAGGGGLTLARSESASASLLGDLRSDVGMEWVPRSMWLSYLQVDAPAGTLDYDLAVSSEKVPRPELAAATGVATEQVRPVTTDDTPWLLVGGVGAAALFAAVVVGNRADRRRVGTAR